MRSRLLTNAFKWFGIQRTQQLVNSSTGCDSRIQTWRLQGIYVEEWEKELYKRSFSTEALTEKKFDNENLFRLLFSSRSPSPVLREWQNEGKPLDKFELISIVKRLRKYGKYRKALEVSHWMQKFKEFEFIAGEYAIYMDLIGKVHGMARVEKYFSDLPEFTKDKYTYGALLHCYVKEGFTEKAEQCMQKILDLGFVINTLPFNNIMSLYMASGQVGKVPSVIKQMKKMNVLLNAFTYKIWLNACASMSDIEAVENIMDEIKSGGENNVTWDTYITLANIYIKSGLVDKAESALKEVEKMFPQRESTAYEFLITMYATLGNKEDIYRIWQSLKMAFNNATDSNYKAMLSSLVKVGDIEGAEKCFEEWELVNQTYDCRVPNILLAAYIMRGMVEKAEIFHNLVVLKGCTPNSKSWEILAEGYLESKQMKKAVRALKNALSLVKYPVWQPKYENVMAILKYFEEQGNIEGAQEYLELLGRIKFVTTQIYNSILSTYAKAGKAAPKISEQMVNDNVSPDEETHRLLKLIIDKS